MDSLQKSDHPTLVAQCHVFLRSVRRNSGKIADKNSREEKIYNMRPADIEASAIANLTTRLGQFFKKFSD